MLEIGDGQGSRQNFLRQCSYRYFPYGLPYLCSNDNMCTEGALTEREDRSSSSCSMTLLKPAQHLHCTGQTRHHINGSLEGGTYLAIPIAHLARSIKGMPVDRVLCALLLACRPSAAAGKKIARAGKLATGKGSWWGTPRRVQSWHRESPRQPRRRGPSDAHVALGGHITLSEPEIQAAHGFLLGK